jgi:hypothetical protein
VLQGSKQGFAKESKDWWCREYKLKVKFALLHWQLHVARDRCSTGACGGKNDKDRKWTSAEANEGVDGRVRFKGSGRQSGTASSSFVLLGERINSMSQQLTSRAEEPEPKPEPKPKPKPKSESEPVPKEVQPEVELEHDWLRARGSWAFVQSRSQGESIHEPNSHLPRWLVNYLVK